ncbi:LysR family transcriptional regulator for metE and metH [Pedobacter cryoconitis]|uniref:LysR family transcriptional regulator n=1 Tax=Pedobacter cryoconitis TaxID=188932 RepID=UPI001618D648|nr:LysR family transcriptional regulator [Pedobacter cryoconitis]MBB6273999.1 LysR family transcriptional regulator for metE and metH [Pedobacter cryoconitis]
MELRHLNLIKTIAEEKGITKSLGKLFLTQSAVSHQLKDIEERIGAKIFYRTKNQWLLTDEGKILYDSAVIILKELNSAMVKVNELREGHTGCLRIATECYTSYHWLPSFLSKMNILYPDLEVKIIIEATHKPLEKLLSNELDVAITSDPATDKSIRYIELFKDEVIAIVQKDNILARKKYLNAPDFSDQTLIIHSYPMETVTVYQHFLKGHQTQPKQVIAIPLTEVALEMVKTGMGIMTLPLWSLKPFVNSHELLQIKIGQKGLIRTHYAAIRQEDSSKKYILDFIENLKEELCNR